MPVSEWSWTGDLAGSTLGAVARQYESALKPEHTVAQIVSLQATSSPP
ncbi:hypothetical protein [Streptomyces halstedii]